MVLDCFGLKKEVFMAMGPERSKPLHNFTLPCGLKWGNQRYLRCGGSKIPDGEMSSYNRRSELMGRRKQETTGGGGPAPTKFQIATTNATVATSDAPVDLSRSWNLRVTSCGLFRSDFAGGAAAAGASCSGEKGRGEIFRSLKRIRKISPGDCRT
ncbi:hypothetical protein HAX54_035404 [Datura stramonium]|uniref:Uncharacterized protein n=1 Tax=Datura stramonium TaxID=4076 RepID=A0ABS8VGY0_DATST|nr:hypothetical protein [Datura stramonium]